MHDLGSGRNTRASDGAIRLVTRGLFSIIIAIIIVIISIIIMCIVIITIVVIVTVTMITSIITIIINIIIIIIIGTGWVVCAAIRVATARVGSGAARGSF